MILELLELALNVIATAAGERRRPRHNERRNAAARRRSAPWRRKGRLIATLSRGDNATVSGRVKQGRQLLVAPMTGRPCVAWSVRVARVRFDGTRQWKPIRTFDQATDFLLVQGADTLPVCCSMITLDLTFDEVGEEQSAGRYDGLQSHPELAEFLLGLTTRYCWEERVLFAGEEVQCRGLVYEQAGVHGDEGVASYRDAPMQKVLGPRAKGSLEIVAMRS